MIVENKLIPENVTRKLDHLGRITLPKSLRDRMYLNNMNDELEIFTAVIDGRHCICLTSPVDEDSRIIAAADVFKECGVTLPPELQARYEEAMKKKENNGH